MGWTSMNQNSIKFILFLSLRLLQQMCEIVLHIKAKEIINFDSIHFLKIKFETSKSEEQDAWKSFQTTP